MQLHIYSKKTIISIYNGRVFAYFQKIENYVISIFIEQIFSQENTYSYIYTNLTCLMFGMCIQHFIVFLTLLYFCGGAACHRLSFNMFKRVHYNIDLLYMSRCYRASTTATAHNVYFQPSYKNCCISIIIFIPSRA